MCVCACVFLHVFILKHEGIQTAAGLCGLMTSRTVNWPTRLFPCNAYFHGQTWIYHTHTHMSNTHMLKSKHKVSLSQMLLSASKLYYWHMRAVLMWHTVMQSWDTHMALISSFKCGKHVCLRKPMALCSATAAKLFPYRFKKCSIDRKISWGALFI